MAAHCSSLSLFCSPSFALPLAATANVTVTVAVTALTPLLALHSFPLLL